MRDRKKRTMIIGILCCLLVFMGVGYAFLSQTLTISGSATLEGKWKIYIESMTIKEKSLQVVAEEPVVEDGLKATFSAQLYKPGDYVEYDVVVKNEGTINAVLRELIPTIESNNMDILLTHSIIQGQILKAGSSTKFTVKVRFDEKALEIPKGATTTFNIEMIYEQYDGDTSGIVDGVVPVTSNDCFEIDDDGVITNYDYSCGTYVTIPAVVNGTIVKEISGDAFINADLASYEHISNDSFYYIVENTDAYNKAYDLLISAGFPEEEIGFVLFMKGQEGFPDLTDYEIVMAIKFDETSEEGFELASADIEYLDLSQATGLKRIGAGAFASDPSATVLKHLNLDETDIEDFGYQSIQFANLDSLTITTDMFDMFYDDITATVDKLRIYAGESTEIPDQPNDYSDYKFTVNKLIIEEGITRIGNYAFKGSEEEGEYYGPFNVRSVELPESLIEIGDGAFMNTSITEITLPSKLRSVGNYSFQRTDLTSVNIPDSLEIIGDAAFGSSQLTKLKVSTALKVKSIGNSAFAHTNLSEFEYYGYETDDYMDSRFAWFIDVDTIGDYAFRYTKLQEIRTKNVKNIGVAAFEGNSTLTTVRINTTDSDITETIGESAFANCALHTLTLVNIKNIGNYAFKNNNLSDSDYVSWNTTSSTIETIGDMIFYGNPGFSVGGYWKLGCNIKSIGSNAFMNVRDLKLETYVQSVTYDGYTATKEGTQIGDTSIYYYYQPGGTCG